MEAFLCVSGTVDGTGVSMLEQLVINVLAGRFVRKSADMFCTD